MAISAGLASVATAKADGPSFDCTAAMLPAEAAICGDPKLARMDMIIAKAYKAYAPEFGNKKAIGRALVADRNACKSDLSCIAAVEVNPDTLKPERIPRSRMDRSDFIAKERKIRLTDPQTQMFILPRE